MLTLGIGGLLHDGAAALLRDGEIVAAIEEEKLLRRPHPGGLPQLAIDSCLDIAGVQADQLDCVALARPLGAPEGSPFHLHVKSLFPNSRIVIADHHVAHAAGQQFLGDRQVTGLGHPRGAFGPGVLEHEDAVRIDVEIGIIDPQSEVFERLEDHGASAVRHEIG